MSRTTVVVPCYNEAARLDVGKFRDFARRNRAIRFLFVNDGSTDDTSAVLRDLERSDPGRFEVLDLAQNMGKAEAVRRGMLRAMGSCPELVGFWDADLATPLETISEFCDILRRDPELLMAIGSRVRLLGRKIERRPIRHYLGRMFATVASLLLRLPIYDTQCGAKLFRVSPELRVLFAEPFRTKWVFDVELFARLIRARGAGSGPPVKDSIYEVPLLEWCDVASSKVKSGDFAKAIVEMAMIYGTYLRPRRKSALRTEPHTPAVETLTLKLETPDTTDSNNYPRREAA